MQRVIARRARARGRDEGGGEAGQSLVEFALVTPILFVLLFGIIQMALTFGGHTALSSAVRDTARYASTAPVNTPTLNVRTHLLSNTSRNIPAYGGDAEVTANISYCYFPNPGTPATYSYRVAVEARYKHVLFVPIVGVFIDGMDGTSDGKFATAAREEMRVETQPLNAAPAGVTSCAL